MIQECDNKSMIEINKNDIVFSHIPVFNVCKQGKQKLLKLITGLSPSFPSLVCIYHNKQTKTTEFYNRIFISSFT